MLRTLISSRRSVMFSIVAVAACAPGVGTPTRTGSGGSGSPGVGTGAGGVAGPAGGGGSTGGAGVPGGSGGANGGTSGGGATGGNNGGAATGGRNGGAATGGSNGGGSTGTADGGIGPVGTDAGTSAGCGALTWPMGGTANPQMLNVTTGATTTARQFYFAVPTTYVSSRPTRVVFAWHYAGGTAAMVAGTGGGAGRYYGLQPLLTDAIFVTGQGLNDAQGRTGWPNTNGQDVDFARAMVDWVKTNFCVDTTRIMSTGFSYGAIMSHTVACQMPDVFRAVGLMAGMLIGRATTCVNHPIAAWMTHGTADTAAIGGVDFANGVTAKDRIVTLNHCGTTTQPTTPAPCVTYDGCDAGYPTVWCPVQDELHVIPSFAPSAIATFFNQF